MTDPIALTREERNAAVEQMRLCGSEGYGYGYGTALDDIVGVINMVRQGDPVGLIRKHATSYAIRRKWGWLLVHDDHVEEFKGPLDPQAWPLAYRPGVS